MGGPRLDEVKDNAFRLPSRLNSTWGGNFTDMVRSTHLMRIIEQENLVENAAKVGALFPGSAARVAERFNRSSAGLAAGGCCWRSICPIAKTREEMWKGLFDLGVLTLRSGENRFVFGRRSISRRAVVDEAMELIRKYCGE